ncbi:MAG: hypothetical protein KAG28_02365 [Cocleimonas sp.]|nr:hypothetical protein [Cocleimonas sp.]
MKKLTLVTSIAFAFTLAATTVYADYPAVSIDSDIILNYDKEIDLSDSVSIPSVILDEEADVSINQFNHDSPVSATANVIGNTAQGGNDGITDLKVNVTAVGNNASVDIATDTVVGAIQGNQNGGATASGNIVGNRINLGQVKDADGKDVDGLVELNVTAVGNNLTIANAEGDDSEAVVGSLQFNYDSPVTATGNISGNGFGVNPRFRDPKLAVTAVGNNLTSVLGTRGSMTQINRNSAISASGYVNGNRGDIGPVSVDVTAVGNNLSIKAPITK